MHRIRTAAATASEKKKKTLIPSADFPQQQNKGQKDSSEDNTQS